MNAEAMDRRIVNRKPAKLPVRFRVVRESTGMRVSDLVDGVIRDISKDGIAVETPEIVVDGLHISYDEHPATKNRVYLQFELPSKRSIKAVGETVWYERVSSAEPWFVVGVRFVEITAQDRAAIDEFLEDTVLDRPLPM